MLWKYCEFYAFCIRTAFNDDTLVSECNLTNWLTISVYRFKLLTQSSFCSQTGTAASDSSFFSLIIFMKLASVTFLLLVSWMRGDNFEISCSIIFKFLLYYLFEKKLVFEISFSASLLFMAHPFRHDWFLSLYICFFLPSFYISIQY